MRDGDLFDGILIFVVLWLAGMLALDAWAQSGVTYRLQEPTTMEGGTQALTDLESCTIEFTEVHSGQKLLETVPVTSPSGGGIQTLPVPGGLEGNVIVGPARCVRTIGDPSTDSNTLTKNLPTFRPDSPQLLE